MIYLDFGKKSQKIDIFNFWFFHENLNKSHTKPLFLNFGLTHTDVFFDEESESDVIFDKNLTPKG